MNRLRKICLLIAASLCCTGGIFAQVEKNPADTTAVNAPAAPQKPADDDAEEPLPPFDEKAPILKGTPKRYFIRKINLRGIEFLNKNVVQASTGLVPGEFDLSAERKHRGRDRQAVEPASVRRRQGRRPRSRATASIWTSPCVNGRASTAGSSRAKGSAKAARRTSSRSCNSKRRRALGLRDRQEHEAHQEILRREGVPKRRGQRAHRERSGHPECRERDPS